MDSQPLNDVKGDRHGKEPKFFQAEKILLLACKIALGSCFAFYTAELLHFEYASSVGTVALLTLVTRKMKRGFSPVEKSVMRCTTVYKEKEIFRSWPR